MQRIGIRAGLLAMALSLCMSTSVRAIIVFQDPGRLMTMPVLSGDIKPGWQFIGNYGSFTGIPIGPRAWVTATHVSGATGTLSYNNAGTTSTVNYASTRAVTSGDLAVFQLNDDQPDFTEWAPVWSNPNTLTVDMAFYLYGRGTNRGSEIAGVGWNWGSANSTLSYGTNNLTGLAADGGGNVYLAMAFDQPSPSNGLPMTEGMFSSGDSGGAIFAFNAANDQWELIGINYAVDLFSATANGTPINAAMYDARGYYAGATLITGDTPVPANSYSTALPFKYDVLAPFIPVPEPSTWIMGTLAAGGLLLTARRRRVA